MSLPETPELEAALAGLSLQPTSDTQPLFINFIPKRGPLEALADAREMPEVFFPVGQEDALKSLIRRVEAELNRRGDLSSPEIATILVVIAALARKEGTFIAA